MVERRVNVSPVAQGMWTRRRLYREGRRHTVPARTSGRGKGPDSLESPHRRITLSRVRTSDQEKRKGGHQARQEA